LDFGHWDPGFIDSVAPLQAKLEFSVLFGR
jgi:hypothetical protein